MKQLTFFKKFLGFTLLAFLIASCGTDGTGDLALPPVVNATLTSASDVIPAETTFTVEVKGDKGDNPMTSLSVLENGLEISSDRINYNNSGIGTNPISLSGADQTEFTWSIEIVAQAGAGSSSYSFVVGDSGGETDESSKIQITTTTGPLTISFVENDVYFWEDATFDEPTTFSVKVNAERGASPMSTLTVLEDGVAVDASRAKFNTVNDINAASDFPTNPLDLINDEKQSISWVLWIASHDEGTKTYTIRVADEDGTTEEVSLNITIEGLTTDFTGKLLLNAGGGVGTGGIDLHTGNGTGSNDPLAELKDLGIDINLPVSQNWRKKIAPVNGSVLKTPGVDYPVDDFSAISSKSEIQLAFDAGTTITESGVAIGDVFIVGNGSDVFLVHVTDIVETSADNKDYYQLSIKR